MLKLNALNTSQKNRDMALNSKSEIFLDLHLPDFCQVFKVDPLLIAL